MVNNCWHDIQSDSQVDLHDSSLTFSHHLSIMPASPHEDAQADMEPRMDDLTRRVSTSFGLSGSPIATYHSTSPGNVLTRAATGVSVKHLKPFATEDIKILLLENINKTGRDALEAQGYQVEFLKSSLSEDELIEKIRWGTQVIRRACSIGR